MASPRVGPRSVVVAAIAIMTAVALLGGCTRTESRGAANSVSDSASSRVADSAPIGHAPAADSSGDRATRDSVGRANGGRDMAGKDKAGERASADTARGIVRRVGPEPTDQLALFVAASAPLALTTNGTRDSLALGAQLQAAEGLEIVVSGERTAQRSFRVAPTGAAIFRVTGFFVRASDGVEARDGVLRAIDQRWYLEQSDGSRQRVVDPPAALRDQVGARVFLVGPPDRSPQAFGILRAP